MIRILWEKFDNFHTTCVAHVQDILFYFSYVILGADDARLWKKVVSILKIFLKWYLVLLLLEKMSDAQDTKL